MKTQILFLILLVLFAQNTIGQWLNLPTFPTNENVRNVSCITSSKVIIGTESGKLYLTENGGDSWNILPFVAEGGANYIHFDANGNGFILEENTSKLYKSTDYGNSWGEIYQNNNLAYFLQIVNTQVAVTLTAYPISFLFTTDGGLNWYNSPPIGDEVWAYYFINENLGWVGTHAHLLKTNDGGNSYDTLQVSGTTQVYPDKIVFIDSLNGWLTTHSPSINGLYKTNDGGLSWEKKCDINDYTLDLFAFNQDTLVINIRDFYLRYLKVSFDGGISWNILDYSNYISDIDCYGDSLIWAVGQHDLLEKSIDFDIFSSHGSGRIVQGVNDIEVVKHNEFIYANQFGSFLPHTIDGGMKFDRIWPQVAFDNTAFLEVESYYDTLYVSSEYGSIFKSTDQGNSWDMVYMSNYNFKSLDLKLVDGKEVFMLLQQNSPSQKSLLVKSEDYGNSWESIEVTSDFCDQLSAPSDQNLFILAPSVNLLYKSSDAGDSWEFTDIPDEQINNISFLNDSIGFLSYNGLYKTSNAGFTWDTIFPYSIDDRVYLHYFHTEDKGMILLHDGIYYTSDGGNNWDISWEGEIWDELNPPGIDFYSENFGVVYFLGFENGSYRIRFLKTLNGGQNWIQSIDQNFYFTIYPVPVVDNLQFHCEEQVIKAIIYDQAGRVCLNMEMDLSTSGSIDVHSLKPGAYIICLFNIEGNFAQKKFVKQ